MRGIMDTKCGVRLQNSERLRTSHLQSMPNSYRAAKVGKSTLRMASQNFFAPNVCKVLNKSEISA